MFESLLSHFNCFAIPGPVTLSADHNSRTIVWVPLTPVGYQKAYAKRSSHALVAIF